MISYADARQRVLAECRVLESRPVPLAEAAGAVLAEPIQAAHDVPPFANSAMDGYAVRAADVASAGQDDPVRLEVIGTAAAGAVQLPDVGPAQALRIMTGAAWPKGADAVAIVENTTADEGSVLVHQPARAGQHIRAAGDDIRAGQDLFAPGEELTPAHIGVLASVGHATVRVIPTPRVGVLSTGDELVDPSVGESLPPGAIRDSNRPTLLALLARDGFEPIDLGRGADDVDELVDLISEAAGRCDALVTSGGVSMGAFDHIRSALDRLAKMSWMQVAIRPAKPLAFGVVDGAPVFGLPGNPVSSLVSYELFARPGLRRLAGHPDDRLDRPRIWAVAEEPLPRRPDGRTAFLRVTARFGEDGRCRVRPVGAQGSHQLWATAGANALAVLPDGPGVSAGNPVEVMIFRW